MNDIHQVEVVVHIDESLNDEQRSGLVWLATCRNVTEWKRQDSQQDAIILW